MGRNARLRKQRKALGFSPKNLSRVSSRLALERFDICEFYAIDPESLTIDDVLWDDQGRKRKGIKRIEALLWDGLSLERDEQAIKSLRQWGENLTAQDLPHNTLQLLACENLEWRDVLERAKTQEYSSETPWVVDFANRLLENPEDCNRAFEFWPDEYLSAEEILGMALESFAVSTEGCLDASGEWMYRVDHENLQRLKGVLERRARAMQRDGSPWKDFIPASPPRRHLGRWTKMQWDEREDIDAG